MSAPAPLACSSCHSYLANPNPPSLLPQVSDEMKTGALFSCLKFSLDGAMLLAVAEGRIYVLDSFEGKVVQKVGPLLIAVCGAGVGCTVEAASMCWTNQR